MDVKAPSSTNDRVVALSRDTLGRMRLQLERLNAAFENASVSIVGDGAYLKLEDAADSLQSSLEMILRTNTPREKLSGAAADCTASNCTTT
jgi:hypothetical protein